MNQYICIVCPNSCLLTVEDRDGHIDVHGNQCKRGEEFAVHEYTHPMRMFTSTMKIEGAQVPRISVISRTEIPKEKIGDCQKKLSESVLYAPVHCGDIVVSDIAGTGVDLVASRTLERV